jgi:putative MFS transporter
MRKLTLEEAIERIGFGRFQLRLLFVCGAGWAADAMEVLIISFVIPALMKEWKLSAAQAGFLGTAIFLGMLAGAWFWGTVSDYIGRRLGFQLTVLVDSVFGFLSALAPNFPTLALLRALTGFGVGGTLPVDYSIFAEYLPKEKRGRYLVILESFWAVGSIVAAGLAWLIVPRVGWRTLLAVSAVPGIIIYFIRRYVPESPRYLLISGREEEARKVLEQVARENGVSVEIPGLVAEPRRAKVTVPALWRGNLIPITLMLWIVWFTISLGYYGVFIWLPKIFVARGFTFLQTYANVFIMSLGPASGVLLRSLPCGEVGA